MQTGQVYYVDHIHACFGSDKDIARKFGTRESYAAADPFERCMIDRCKNIGRLNNCLYCSSALDFFTHQTVGTDNKSAGRECQNCGWWFLEVMESFWEDSDDKHFSANHYYEGVLRRFEITPTKAPLIHLQDYLTSSDIEASDPHELAACCRSVFREHFNCEARPIGQTYTGSAIFCLIEADPPFVVQFCRRKRSVPTVDVIREFLGASVKEMEFQNLFYSTASEFTSTESRAKILSPLVPAFGIYVPLLDCSAIQDLCEKRNVDAKPWKQHFMSAR